MHGATRKPGLAIQRLARACISSKKAWNRQWDYNPWMASGEHGSQQPVRATDAEPDGTLAKELASEDILEILRMILGGASLKEVLTSVARVVESHQPQSPGAHAGCF